MSETKSQILSAASETSLMAVYIRAMESQRPDALINDEKAVALVAQMSDEFARLEQIPMNDALKVTRNLATREYDRRARDFLRRHPDAVVVHIGCGLDSRFDRVAERNGQVEWYDLDLPDVIELRRKLFGDEGERHVRLQWGIWHGQEMEKWGDGIRLLDEWGFFDPPGPRLAHLRWLRPLEAAIRTSRIYHFQLGKAAEG